MPLERDEEEEVLARIEQRLETLREEVERFSAVHQRSLAEARIVRTDAEAVRDALRHERRVSARRRATRNGRKR